jgi:hypothetical protein
MLLQFFVQDKVKLFGESSDMAIFSMFVRRRYLEIYPAKDKLKISILVHSGWLIHPNLAFCRHGDSFSRGKLSD